MGATPMATRTGSLDPSAVLFLKRQLKMTTEAVGRMLWCESGLLEVSGRSRDMRQLLVAADDASKLAVTQFVMRVAQGVAAMATSPGVSTPWCSRGESAPMRRSFARR